MKKDNPFTLTFGKQPVKYMNSTQPLLAEFAMRLTDASKQIPNIFETGFEVSVAGFGVGYNGGAVERDSVSRIESILEKLEKKNKRVLITIDEAVADENIYEIQNDPVLTFLLRAPKIVLGPLGLNQIKNEYQEIFEIEEETARKLANITMGYAFAFQALGMLYWEYRDEKMMQGILKELDALLEDFVYKKIWSGLSDLEKKIIAAMPDERSKIRAKDLCSRLNMKGSNFSKYRERLINKGVCIAPEYGYLAIILPRFKSIVSSYEIYE